MISATLVALTLVLATLADVYTTKRAVIDDPGRFHEGNPLAAALIDRAGLTGFAVVKLVGAAGLIALLIYFRSWAANGPVLAAAAFLGWVAWRNKRLIARHR